jgi:hypothetical protein
MLSPAETEDEEEPHEPPITPQYALGFHPSDHQARRPLWIPTLAELEEYGNRWTPLEWWIYHGYCDKEELEDDKDRYPPQGYTHHELERWRNRWTREEWDDYLYGVDKDQRTPAWRILERNWYEATLQETREYTAAEWDAEFIGLAARSFFSNTFATVATRKQQEDVHAEAFGPKKSL